MKGILFKPAIWEAKKRVLQERGMAVTRQLGHLQKVNAIPDMWKWIGRDQEGRFSFRFEPSGDVFNYFPPYRPGEVVYVKEAWCLLAGDNERGDPIFYKANPDEENEMEYLRNHGENVQWHSPLFMPAWAARDFLKVDVRPERLWDITEEDALMEGVASQDIIPIRTARQSYQVLWDSTYPKTKWETNPWCWRLELRETAKSG